MDILKEFLSVVLVVVLLLPNVAGYFCVRGVERGGKWAALGCVGLVALLWFAFGSAKAEGLLYLVGAVIAAILWVWRVFQGRRRLAAVLPVASSADVLPK